MPDTAKAQKKPDAIKVLCFIFIIISALIIYSPVSGLLSYDDNRIFNTPPKDRPFLFSFISEHFVSLAVLQIIIGVMTFIASVQFYRLKPWARTALEIIAWCLLLYIIGLGAFMIYIWTITFSFMDSGALAGVITWGECGGHIFPAPGFFNQSIKGKKDKDAIYGGSKIF